jgi:hypothetical protein
MADDRHETYRALFATAELNKLFKDFKNKHSVASIAYDLLTMQKTYPNESVPVIVDKTRELLNGSRI